MSIRVEVQPDERIEIMRPREDGGTAFAYFRDLEDAIAIIRYLLRRDLKAAKRERFVPQLDRECKKLLRDEIKG